jgi:hypothetical protein
MPTVTPTVALQAYFSGTGAAATDITADVVLGVSHLRGKYGISGSGPLARIARAGTLTFAMNNSESNSGGKQGYYTPGHVNARTGWDLGLVLAVHFTYGGTTYVKFIGTLTDVKPDAGRYRRQAVRCTVADWMNEAARSKVKATAVQTNQRSDQLVSTIVTNSVGRQPIATSYATGKSTFAYALDNLRDNKTSVLRALADVVMSEMGYLYVRGTTTAAGAKGGQLRFESRETRATAGDAVHTFANDMVALEARRSRGDIINRTYVEVHPRTLDGSASTLWETTDTEVVPVVGALSSTTIIAEFTASLINGVNFGGSSVTTSRGGHLATTNLTTPASGTDWVANAAADGTGANLTSSVTVAVATTASNTATLTVTNAASVDAYLTTLQLRGVALRDETPTSTLASDSASITNYGEQDLRLSLPYESNPATGAGIADWFTGANASPRFVVKSMTLAANSSDELMTQALAREPGDKIGVDEYMTGLSNRTAWLLGTAGSSELNETTYLDFNPSSGDFFINGVTFDVGPGNIVNVKWSVAPADQQRFWILQQAGASELGTTTILGWG